jgi:hypothetical protein
MAIEDYIPNVFGGAPTMYQGLLNPKDQAALERRANLGGLLGFAGALAQGMSPQGYRRSALQNVLSALGAGYGGAAQTYESGINQLANVQKLQQSQSQMQAINQLLQDPRVANDPMMVAYIRANPAEAIKYFAEMAPFQQALTGAPSAAPAPVSAAPAPAAPAPVSAVPTMPEAAITEAAPEANVLPPVSVTAAPPKPDPLLVRKQQLLGQIDRLSAIPTKIAETRIDTNLKQIKAIDEQISRRAVEEFDFATVRNAVPPRFKSEVDDLQQLALSGGISGNDLRLGLNEINKRATEFVTKKTDYTNQDRRVAASMFRNPDGTPKAIEELEAAELMQLENKLFDLDIQKRRAGATTINMPTESERTAGYLTTRLKNSFEQYQQVLGEDSTASLPSLRAEIIKGVTRSDYLKNLATPENRQRVEAAQLDMISAALTLSTGAAYTKEELEAQRSTYFPQLGDKPGTIRDKATRLDKLLKEAAMVKAGRSAPGMPSGTNAPAFDANAIQMELDRRKGK